MKKQSVKGVLLVLMTLGLSAHAAVPKKLSLFPEGERLIYARLLQAFHQNQYAQVIHERQLLERNYPNSIHLDNAYYLTGMLDFQGQRYGEALKDFDVVRDHFVKSNKRPAALFGTAMTYEKLGLKGEARRVLQILRHEYPGSPESERAMLSGI